MGANQNRFGDKIRGGNHEWGSKLRKAEHQQRKHTIAADAIDDQVAPKPSTGTQRRKKNTRRWCKGKEGVEHQWIRFSSYEWMRILHWKCTGCDKESWPKPKHGVFVNE